jgi:hypothetical protein
METRTPPAGRTRLAIATAALAAVIGVWTLQTSPAPSRGFGADASVTVTSNASATLTVPAKADIAGLPTDLPVSKKAAADNIPAADRDQLHAALDSARREVIPISGADATLPANQDVLHFAQNPAGRVHARFLSDRVRFATGDAPGQSAELRFSGATATSSVETTTHRVTYRHGQGVSEWFENGPAGIEHGFIFDSRPADAPGESLHVDLALGNATATPGRSADELLFLNDAGQAILSYASLKAWDATGTALPATMAAVDGGIRLRIDDRHATYPVMIDPLVTAFEQKLLPEITGLGNPQDYFGTSIALDGDTAIVSAPASGDAYIFVRQGSEWSLQDRLLVPDNPSYASPSIGAAVAIDGDTVAVTELGYGRVHVFTRSGTTWSLQASLRSANMTWWNFGSFGYSLALEGDRILIGIPGDNGNRGAACFFERSGTTWTEGPAIYAPDGVANDYFGYSAALSGTTALLGAPGDSSATVPGCGSARVFVLNAGAWSEQATLRPQVTATGDNVGYSVALEGNTAILGAPGTDSLAGAALVFTRNTTFWAQRAKLAIVDPVIRLGWSVGLSGNTVVASGFWYRPPNSLPVPYTGSVAVFTGSGSSWTRQQLLGSDSGPTEKGFGVSAAVSADTILVGAYWDEDAVYGRIDGRAHAFIRSASTWSHQAHIDDGDTKHRTHFGSALAFEGDVAVFGTSEDTTPRGYHAGAAYVMTRSAGVWTNGGRFYPEDGKIHDRFGVSAAIEGDTILVGSVYATVPDSPVENRHFGRVYLYKKIAGVWSLQSHFDNPEPHDVSGMYGSAIAISGDTVAIGDHYEGDFFENVNTAGCVYTYTRTGDIWSAPTKLVAETRAIVGFFGKSLALDGDHLLVGAPHQLRAEMFHRSGGVWTRQQVILPDQAVSTSGFANAVALDGGTALVSIVRSTEFGAPVERGVEVFVLSGGSWTRQATLLANDSDVSANFGYSVALQGDTAVTGAITADYRGAVYVFTRTGTTWTQQSKLIAPDAYDRQHLGERVAIDGDTVIATAPRIFDETDSDTGSAYVFRLGASQADLTVEDKNHNLIGEGGNYDYGIALTTSGPGWGDTFTLGNPGYADLTGITAVSSAPADFGIESLTKTTIAPGSTALLAIDFHPTASGLRTATITISSPERADFTFTVSGTGNQPPVISTQIYAAAYQQELLLDITQVITDADDTEVTREVSTGTTLSGGTVTREGNTVRYVPKSTWSGKDYIHFVANDNRGGSDSAYIVIDVVGPHWVGQMTTFSQPLGSGTPATLTFRSTPWRGWIFQRSTDLQTWTEVSRNNTYESDIITFTDPSPPAGKAYYRLKDPL